MQHLLDVSKDQARDMRSFNIHKGAGFSRYSHLTGKMQQMHFVKGDAQSLQQNKIASHLETVLQPDLEKV